MQFSKIRIIPCNSFSARWNMAADEYLLNHSDLPVLRFYQWEKPSLSFGRSNTTTFDLDFKAIYALDIQGVIRPTGGKTVLHHKELTYAVITQDIALSILDFYKEIGAILQSVFLKLGIQTEMRKEKKKDASLICFKDISSYELTIADKKIIGSAQKRRKNRILQHGAILLDVDFSLWSRIWKSSEEVLKKKVIFLRELIPDLKATKLENLIIREFCQQAKAKKWVKDFDKEERKQIELLSKNYFWKEFEQKKNQCKKIIY